MRWCVTVFAKPLSGRVRQSNYSGALREPSAAELIATRADSPRGIIDRVSATRRGDAMLELSGRVAVITGAASGIGLAIARRLAREGMALVLADIEPAPLAQALADIRILGVDAIAVPVDVVQQSQLDGLADAAYAHFGKVHVLCNNAGVGTAAAIFTPAWMTRLEDWQWMLGVNLMGVVHGVRAFVPRMLALGDEGHVVNTASVAGLLTASNPYHVSKHGVACLTEGLYKDFRRAGARLSASVLCPGLIRTSILNAQRNRPPAFGPATDTSQLPGPVQQATADFAQRLDAGYEPSLVADAVADAIRADRFYVIPAQEYLLDNIALRMNDILGRRNPTLASPAQPNPPPR
jgi:NAD(P)-dependent dehydrogenase (short-subunit alcohol dehydrogenase family)